MDTKKSPAPLEVSVTVLSQMFLYLESLKVDIDVFLRTIGLDPAEIHAFDAHIPVETYLFIQDSAADYVHDPYFGLHYGEFAEVGSWSILGYLMMNCKTLGEAIDKSGRYQRIIGNLIQARAELHFLKARAVFFTPPYAPSMSRHCFEATFSSLIRIMRNLAAKRFDPVEVTFKYSQPVSASEYERIFCCPVRFGQKENSITIDPRVLNLPVRLANPMLRDQFEQYAQEVLVQMERKDGTSQAVTRILLAHLDDESMSIQKVAREMSVSVRTLQKRLEVDGVVFSDLLRDVREHLAKKYLRENYSVEQITYLLGFSEPSVFRKAFKKWSGLTPREYRQKAYPGLAS